MSRFRVLQFNMQFGQMWNDVYPDRAPVRLSETLAEVRRHDADIILLQEVEQALAGAFNPSRRRTMRDFAPS